MNQLIPINFREEFKFRKYFNIYFKFSPKLYIYNSNSSTIKNNGNNNFTFNMEELYCGFKIIETEKIIEIKNPNYRESYLLVSIEVIFGKKNLEEIIFKEVIQFHFCLNYLFPRIMRFHYCQETDICVLYTGEEFLIFDFSSDRTEKLIHKIKAIHSFTLDCPKINLSEEIYYRNRVTYISKNFILFTNFEIEKRQQILKNYVFDLKKNKITVLKSLKIQEYHPLNDWIFFRVSGEIVTYQFLLKDIISKFKLEEYDIVDSPKNISRSFKKYPDKKYLIFCLDGEIEVDSNFLEELKSDYLDNQSDESNEIYLPLFKKEEISRNDFKFLDFIRSNIILDVFCEKYLF